MNKNMKNITSNIYKIATFIGITLGAFTISVIAATFTPAPPGTPPNCPDNYAGCTPPINTGNTAQSKTGYLALREAAIAKNLLIATSGTLVVSGGNPTAGKILTAVDNLGTVGWTSPVSPATSGIIYKISTPYKFEGDTGGIFGTPRQHHRIVLWDYNEGKKTYTGPNTVTLKDALAGRGGSAIYRGDHDVTLDHICAELFPNAPYISSYGNGGFDSPKDNGVIIWDEAQGGLVRRGASGYNVVTNSAPITCTSVRTVVFD